MCDLSLGKSRAFNKIFRITPANIFDSKPKHDFFVDMIVSIKTFLRMALLVLKLFGWRESHVFLIKLWRVEWRGSLLRVVLLHLEANELEASELEILHGLNESVDKIKISNRCNRFIDN